MTAIALGIIGTAATGSAAVTYDAWLAVNSTCELSGGWNARVGYLGPGGEDAPAVVQVTGAMVGGQFELDYSHPFSSVSIAVLGLPPLSGGEAFFSGNWMGDGTGQLEETVDGVVYTLTARYTLGGFNPGGNPDDPPEDSQWGWWEGTFSVRTVDCPATVPEAETAGLLALTAGLAIQRRRRAA